MSQLKIAGIVMLVIAGVAVFVGVERYQANASAVAAMNQMGGGMFGAMTGGGELKPSTPAVTKYSFLAAILFGAGGAYCLMKQKPSRPQGTATRSRHDRPDKLDLPSDWNE